MKKIRQWIYANKVTISGLVTLFIFFLDELFNCIGFKTLPDSLYYLIITALYIFVGYSIKGRGLETISQYEEVMRNKANLKTKRNLRDFIIYLLEILFNKQDKSIEESNNQSQTTQTTEDQSNKKPDQIE